MDQTQQKEQKWGFWLFMLNNSSLNLVVRLFLRKMSDTDELSFSQYAVASIIALGLTLGIGYALRRQPLRIKVWTMVIILIISLAAHLPIFH
ncbi:hypothetical protein [Dyadobacter aurulentus]|uniref:hypothetical protein n=1 Tax=Dyadobacter sp. UC 10 TaxID=2605428 RepID=UPI0011F23E00|nr:hypothetical protein [Dyadobacter sp. UC 10]KAA0988775.1 hypothetical protein FXO21_00640 [Dyadobacter sp. UC 10]